MLTALGIIFGVAAVISMLAIGNGAKKEVLDQMKLVGVNNIVITPVESDDNSSSSEESDEEGTEAEEEKSKEKLSRGLTLEEAYSIKKMIPGVERVSPEVINQTRIIYNDRGVKGTFTGVTVDYFDIYSLELEQGSYFSDFHYKHAKQVCVIGHNIKSRLFPTEDALGKQIKCGDVWLTIVGVLRSHGSGGEQLSELKLSDFDMNVYAPLETVLIRYNDRSIVTKKSLKGRGRRSDNSSTETNRNQLDKLVVQVTDTDKLKTTAAVLNKMLLRRHAGAKDFQITVPELLLKQEQKTRSIFNLVLGAIASISLIVGGIGIMNIMLASVMERIREIGVRRAIGATQKDIVFQFLSEATIISVTGGIIGIVLGLVIAQLITQFTEIPTIVSGFSILISFGVSAGIGVIFGYMPAQKAAEKDPVSSLRHE
ncbi:FtsX-like permease family protein [Lentimicrobium sp. L6]|nr:MULTISPECIES: ABC transporter permease [unclassified Lentimicrobium]NPD47777.1 FtsX-like permease family protein [Lentimicrobium sp. S6]NPD86650.1 FtsX-like permease family protein [Lentimicrobium sp. L6]